MSEDDKKDTNRFDLEPFRSYLRVLADLGIGPALRRVVDPSDLVQETLLEAHQAMARFQGTEFGQRAAWLRRILARNLANLARDQGRKKRDVARQVSLEASLAESSLRLGAWMAAPGSTPSEAAMRGERALEIADAIVALPEGQGRALVCRYCMDWTVDEIARHLGTSEAAVAGLLRRGLKKLRETLERP